jgi:hypothetical protein
VGAKEKEGEMCSQGGKWVCDKWMEEKNESQETEGAGLLDLHMTV